MEPFLGFPTSVRRAIRFVLTDVDDTVTSGGRLAASTYAAIERLNVAGLHVIPISAAPAGWCDAIARMWPVDAIIGENGGLCFRYDTGAREIVRRFWADDAERRRSMGRLSELGAQIAAAVPGCQIAPDQAYREATLALACDSRESRRAALDRLKEAGAQSTLNSMWVLGWFGAFDKLSATREAVTELFRIDIDAERGAFVYVGDSLNDEPMFAHFPNSIGVAGVREFVDRMASPPRWVTSGGAGRGFVEVAAALLTGGS
jgi:HAD superfamily hydrolase (TIGR01484 family)